MNHYWEQVIDGTHFTWKCVHCGARLSVYNADVLNEIQQVQLRNIKEAQIYLNHILIHNQNMHGRTGQYDILDCDEQIARNIMQA